MMAAVDPIATRNEAYHSLTVGELGEKQLAVLDALRIGPMSNKALAKHLEWPINCVTPRTKELRDLGLVEAAYEDEDLTTHRKCIVWRLVR